MKKYVFMYVLLVIFFSATETSNFNVKGMMCGAGCVNTINKEINNLKGISKCDVSFENSSMIVTYDNQLVDKKSIMLALNNNTTYTCSLKEDKKNNVLSSFFKTLFGY